MDGSRSRPRGKIVRARRVALAILAAAAGGLAAPRLGRIVRHHLAERAVAGGRLDEAEARLVGLIEEEPGDAMTRLLRAQVARRLGRITEAEEALQRAVELGLPIDEGRREHALMRAGHDFAGAEPALRRLLADHPDDAEVRRALAEGVARADGPSMADGR